MAKIIDDMEKESTRIREESLKMAWYMRGGASYNDVMNMSSSERSAIAAIIKENLDTTKKSGLPFF